MTAPTCAVCGDVLTAGARFCEACGAPVPDGATAPEATAPAPSSPAAAPAGAPCPSCGGEFGDDGYCTTCGAKAPAARDHMAEQPRPWVAGVSDRGARRQRNEDAMALAADEAPGSRAVLVVCDGVSTARDSDVASLAAARASLGVLEGAGPQGMGVASAQTSVLEARMRAAADAAHRAVMDATPPDAGDHAPSCTWVVVVAERDRMVAGVVGDSRAYWVPDDGAPLLLTVDDSWSAEMIAAGLPREQAEAGPHAHAITRWIGADSPDHTPRLTWLTTEGAGWAIACSDGLWNYCSAPEAVGEVVRRLAATSGGEPLALASALVDWANEQGGHDNITVALARLGGR